MPGMRALQLLGSMPQPARRTAGARLGDMARWMGIRRRVAARNLALAFPELPPAARDQILRRHFQLLGAVFLEECALLKMPAEEIRRRIILEDEESLQTRRPVIFCAPHFAAAAVGGIRLTALLGGRVMFYYKPMHNQFWDKFYGRLRKQYGAVGVSATSKNAMLSCARHLKNGGALFYLPDTDPKRRKNAVFAPFLGVAAAATTTAISRLAAVGGAEVRMFSAFLAKDGCRLDLSPPLAQFPGADAAADARRINDLISAQVRRDPAQYYWLHRRFKTRPAGEEDIYA